MIVPFYKLILNYSAQQKLLQQQKQNMTQQICLVFIDIHGTISVEHCVLRKKTIRLVMEWALAWWASDT